MPSADNVHAIILAAGGGRRFGSGKLAASYRGRPLITWAVEAALAGEAETVTVVLGRDAQEIEALLSPLSCARLRTVRCDAWEDGLSASLRCGVDSLPGSPRAVLVFLGDMPDVSHQIAATLLAELSAGAPAALPLCHGLPGHPVALTAELLPRIAGLTGDRGARMLLDGLDGIAEIETGDRGCIRDIDTRAELAMLTGANA